MQIQLKKIPLAYYYFTLAVLCLSSVFHMSAMEGSEGGGMHRLLTIVSLILWSFSLFKTFISTYKLYFPVYTITFYTVLLLGSNSDGSDSRNNFFRHGLQIINGLDADDSALRYLQYYNKLWEQQISLMVFRFNDPCFCIPVCKSIQQDKLICFKPSYLLLLYALYAPHCITQ